MTLESSPAHRRRWLVLGLLDVAAVVALPYMFAFAVIAVGIPVAVLVRLLAWLTGVL